MFLGPRSWIGFSFDIPKQQKLLLLPFSIDHPRAQRHNLISPPCTTPLLASPNLASILYTINHAKQCAISTANNRTRNKPPRIARTGHTTDITPVASFVPRASSFAGSSWAVSLGKLLSDAECLRGTSLIWSSLGASCLAMCGVGGRMSQLASFSFALRVGKGGSHGFRGLDWDEDGALGGAVVPLGGEFVPSVVGHW
jgi:hypothetical protein